jgi:hypothetical protein
MPAGFQSRVVFQCAEHPDCEFESVSRHGRVSAVFMCLYYAAQGQALRWGRPSFKSPVNIHKEYSETRKTENPEPYCPVALQTDRRTKGRIDRHRQADRQTDRQTQTYRQIDR